MFKKRSYIVLMIVVLLWLLVFELPGKSMGKFRLAVGSLFLPLFGLAATTHSAGETTVDFLTPRSELIRRNRELRRQNEALQLGLTQAESLWRENDRLRRELGFPQQIRWKNKLKPARIISRDPTTWWRSVQIDLGRRDGVQVNSPVLTTNGLVGRVQNVGETRSLVVLLGDPSMKVAAFVQGSAESGVILSEMSSPDNIVELGFLSGGSAVAPGQLVETWGVNWGDGGLFPPHIPIGRILDVQSRDYRLTTEARVKLFVDMGALEDVWVLLP